jgi:hypothetical protein
VSQSLKLTFVACSYERLYSQVTFTDNAHIYFRLVFFNSKFPLDDLVDPCSGLVLSSSLAQNSDSFSSFTPKQASAVGGNTITIFGSGFPVTQQNYRCRLNEAFPPLQSVIHWWWSINATVFSANEIRCFFGQSPFRAGVANLTLWSGQTEVYKSSIDQKNYLINVLGEI